MRYSPLPLLAVLACGGAPLLAQPATTLRADDLRVAAIGYRLAEQGISFCPEPYPLTGLLLHHLAEYDAQGRAIEIERHGLDRGPGVLATVGDSPAARVGIMAGDVLIAVNGANLPDPRGIAALRKASQWRAAIEGTEALLENALRRGSAELRLSRAGRPLTISLRPVAGCPARVRLARSNQANAFATGTYVVITSRILEALRDDNELAIIIGHELAHNILRHKQRLQASGTARLGARASEEEADRLGLELADAAGYDVNAATPMWRRLYARFGGGGQLFGSHPSLGARERVIQATIAELEGRRGPG